MKRLSIEARPNWLPTVESDGVLWSTTEVGPYWSEAMEQPKYYSFTCAEQAKLEEAGNKCHSMCIEAVTWLLEEASEDEKTSWFESFGIPVEFRDLVINSWNADEWAMYGRFDFIMTKEGPKLLEYNADTPTTLIESSLTQYNWMQENLDKLPEGIDQFNSIHESLIRHWGDMKKDNNLDGKVHFTSFTQVDDLATAAYMAEVAAEAGIEIQLLPIEQLGYNGGDFIDLNDDKINNIFALYPKEWLWEDTFGAFIPKSNVRWIEPWWKALLSNKAILALLWERNEGNEFLVPSFLNESQIDGVTGDKWVTKPLLSREGMNVTFWEQNAEGGMDIIKHTEGEYDEENVVFQKYIEWVDYDGCYPMLGVWMVGEDAVGLGIREDDSTVTQNNSRFIPHVFGA